MVHHDDERVRVRNRENERDKLTKKKKKRPMARKKAEYELFFKRQTLLLDLSPRIKVKSKKKERRG